MKVSSPIERKMFGSWIREKRKEAGYSVPEAARKIGFSIGRLKQIECGYDPIPLMRLFDIIKIYEIDLEELLERLQAWEPELYEKFIFLERKFLELFVNRYTSHRQAQPQYMG